jgi:hypothetical protein
VFHSYLIGPNSYCTTWCRISQPSTNWYGMVWWDLIGIHSDVECHKDCHRDEYFVIYIGIYGDSCGIHMGF